MSERIVLPVISLIVMISPCFPSVILTVKSEEKGFGLDVANVTVEKFPLIVAPVTNLKLKRIMED